MLKLNKDITSPVSIHTMHSYIFLFHVLWSLNLFMEKLHFVMAFTFQNYCSFWLYNRLLQVNIHLDSMKLFMLWDITNIFLKSNNDEDRVYPIVNQFSFLISKKISKNQCNVNALMYEDCSQLYRRLEAENWEAFQILFMYCSAIEVVRQWIFIYRLSH